MVIYSVLTTESDTQYVRIYTSYNPPENDPSKNPDEESVTDATVRVSSDSSVYEFQQIVLQRPDTSRYSSSIVAYACYPFRPARGKTYRLSVSSPTLGAATAVTTVPGVASISPLNFFCLSSPFHGSSETYGVQVILSSQAKGFLAKIYVDYLATTVDGGYKFKRREIPKAAKLISAWQGTWEYFYPAIRRKTMVNAGDAEVEVFSTDAWIMLLTKDIAVEDGLGSLFEQAVFQVVQFNPPLYDNYGTANLFRDPFSVRLDEADYTNISGGTGVFGSLAVDTTVRALPEHLLPAGSTW
jgi:hypothetical protein